MPPPADGDVQISSVDWVENGSRTGVLLVGRAADGRSASLFFTGCPIYFYVIPKGRPSDKQREAFRNGLDDALFARLKGDAAHVTRVSEALRTPADRYRPEGACHVLRVDFSSHKAACTARCGPMLRPEPPSTHAERPGTQGHPEPPVAPREVICLGTFVELLQKFTKQQPLEKFTKPRRSIAGVVSLVV